MESAVDWCVPGNGATVAELSSLIANDVRNSKAIEHLAGLPQDSKTNLRITGGRLQEIDFSRLVRTEVG